MTQVAGQLVVRARAALFILCLIAMPVACRPAASGLDASRLIVALPSDAGPLNPYLGAPDPLLNLVYDKLFEPSPYVDDPAPGLAERGWQIDAHTWGVIVRDEVTWHDGRPFTAEDVKFTFEYYRDGPASRHGHHVSMVPRVARVEQVGARELRFVCADPCPTLLEVTLADLPVLPRHVWAAVREPRKHTALPIGTGPYRLVEYHSDRMYRLQAYDDHFRGAPLIDELVMPVVPDLSATFLALRTGEIDVAARPMPPELVRQYRDGSVLGVVKTAALSIVELRPNFLKAPFDRPEFRRALSRAIDRQQLVDTVLLGQGRPGTRGYPHPDSPWTNPASSTPFDRAQAQALLEELGYRDRDGDGVREGRDGAPLDFTLKVSSATPAWIRVAELITRQFREVGLRVRLQTLEALVFNRQAGARDYDFIVSETGAHSSADPDQFIVSHLVGYLADPAVPNPRVDALIRQWTEASTVEARRAAGFALQDLLNDEPTSIAVLYPDAYWGFRPSAFAGWVESPGYGIVHKWSFLPAEVRPAGLRPAS